MPGWPEIPNWRFLAAYVLWLPPASLGAALDWSRWLILALLVPGVIWYAANQGVANYRQVRLRDPNVPVGQRVPALYSSTLFAVAIIFLPGQLVGVFIIAGFIYVDLMLWWEERRRTAERGMTA
jgi:uncharacterized membrane protein